MIDKFVVFGNEYEMGFKIGEHFKEYLLQESSAYEKEIKNNEEIYSKVKNMELKLKEEFPICLNEIYGRADGAGISRDTMLLMFFPEIFKKQDGCTTLILKKNYNHVLFSHNEDNVKCSLQNVALIKYIYEDFWIVGYTRAAKLMGSSFAYNSYGLVFSSNYIYGSEVNINNVSRYIMVRDVMNSKTIDEVIDKMKKHKVASAFSLNILDINTGEVINIEKDVEEIYITNINDRYARSNHFIAKKDDLKEPPISSKFRYYKSKELLDNLDSQKATINDVIDILKYETDDYYKSIFKDLNKYIENSVTVANFSIDSNSKRIKLYDYIGQDKIELDYYQF